MQNSSQGQICKHKFLCCHTETEAAHQTCYFSQSMCSDTGPPSPTSDPVMPDAWQYQFLSHWYDSTQERGVQSPSFLFLRPRRWATKHVSVVCVHSWAEEAHANSKKHTGHRSGNWQTKTSSNESGSGAYTQTKTPPPSLPLPPISTTLPYPLCHGTFWLFFYSFFFFFQFKQWNEEMPQSNAPSNSSVS